MPPTGARSFAERREAYAMRAIDRALVDEVWRELTAYDAARTAAEARGFLARQPFVAAFSHAVTQGQDETVQRAALGLCFLLFKVLEASGGRPFREVTEARVVAGHADARAALAELAAPDADAVIRAMDGGAPGLVAHILAAFYGGDGAGAAYDDGVRANLALLLGALARTLALGRGEG
jgi:hypothetical protein